VVERIEETRESVLSKCAAERAELVSELGERRAAAALAEEALAKERAHSAGLTAAQQATQQGGAHAVSFWEEQVRHVQTKLQATQSELEGERALNAAHTDLQSKLRKEVVSSKGLLSDSRQARTRAEEARTAVERLKASADRYAASLVSSMQCRVGGGQPLLCLYSSAF
jgi:hypothetical protein